MRGRASLVIGALALAVVGLVGLAAGVSGQRERRPQRAARRSAIVYPRETIAIRMDHSLAAHAELPCVRCHTGADRSRVTADDLNPAEATCLPCHAEQIRRDASTPGCATCHTGYGVEGPRVVPESSFPDARIRFSHELHVRRGMACESCHAGVEDVALATRDHLPTMRSCMQCHDGRGSAPSECTTCHLRLPDGRVRTQWPEGRMLPPAWLHGMEHDADFIVRHRWVAADVGDLCAQCHTERDCADCHDGRVRPRRVHPNDWLALHAQMSRRDEPRCTSCHNTQHFCVECHARVGVSPIAAPNVRAPARFHPPASAWIDGANGHGREARRSMSACVSCHAERDCVACHGALGIGAGLSPHPRGFADRCQAALDANPRACRACHADVADLAARCR